MSVDLATTLNAPMATRLAGAPTQPVWVPWDNATPAYTWSPTCLRAVAPAVDLTGTAAYNAGGVGNGGILIDGGRFAVICAHYNSMIGDRTWRYVGSDGTIYYATVTNPATDIQQIAGTDIAIVKFAAALPAAVKRYPLPPADLWEKLLYSAPYVDGQGGMSNAPVAAAFVINGGATKMINVGAWKQYLRYKLSSVDEMMCVVYSDATIGAGYWAAGYAGTSGNPVFLILADGTLLPLGVAHIGASNFVGCPFLGAYITEISAKITAMGGTSADMPTVYDASAFTTYTPAFDPTALPTAPTIPQEGSVATYRIGQLTSPDYADIDAFLAALDGGDPVLSANSVLNIILGTGNNWSDGALSLGTYLPAGTTLLLTATGSLTANFDGNATSNRSILSGTMSLSGFKELHVTGGFQLATNASSCKFTIDQSQGAQAVGVTDIDTLLIGGKFTNANSVPLILLARPGSILTVENIIANATTALGTNGAPISVTTGVNGSVSGSVTIAHYTSYAPNSTVNGAIRIVTTNLGVNRTLSLMVNNSILVGTGSTYISTNFTGNIPGLIVTGSGNRGGANVPGTTDTTGGLTAANLLKDAANGDLRIVNSTYNTATATTTTVALDFLGNARPRAKGDGTSIVDIGAMNRIPASTLTLSAPAVVVTGATWNSLTFTYTTNGDSPANVIVTGQVAGITGTATIVGDASTGTLTMTVSSASILDFTTSAASGAAAVTVVGGTASRLDFSLMTPAQIAAAVWSDTDSPVRTLT